MAKYLFIHGHLIIDDSRELLDGALLVEDERIVEVFSQSNKIKEIDEDVRVVDLKGNMVMPGFFDTHIHGLANLDFDSCDESKLSLIEKEMAKQGTTSYLASLSYKLTHFEINKRLMLFENYVSKYSRFMGIHIEGPFILNKYSDNSLANYYYEPDINVINKFLSNSTKIKQMTIALERKETHKIAEILRNHNIKVMAGHSDATIEDVYGYIDGITHLYKYMRSYHHIDKTLVNLALDSDYYFELIADKSKIDKDVIRHTINIVNKDKLMLISDSKANNKEFNGITNEVKLLKSLGARNTELLCYSSLNAFRFYGYDKEYGTLQKGKMADIVCLDDEMNVVFTYVKGEFIYD